MADEGQEFSGKTVEEATEAGLAQLGLNAAQANIEVISRGSRGIFGIGSEPARVRIGHRATPSVAASAPASTTPAAPPSAPATSTPPPADAPAPAAPAPVPVHDTGTSDTSSPVVTDTPVAATPDSATPNTAARTNASATLTDQGIGEDIADDSDEDDIEEDEFDDVDEAELANLASELLEQLITHMGFTCTIASEWREAEDDESERFLHLDIHGNDLGALIGRRGETLASIQYLVRLMVNQRIRQWKPIIVDVENYKERRNTQLAQLATRMAEQVSQSGRAMSLEPMPANERRIIHLTLRDHPEVYTQSSGEGERRKVHIVVRE